jgi:hypothetical protein
MTFRSIGTDGCFFSCWGPVVAGNTPFGKAFPIGGNAQ